VLPFKAVKHLGHEVRHAVTKSLDLLCDSLKHPEHSELLSSHSKPQRARSAWLRHEQRFLRSVQELVVHAE